MSEQKSRDFSPKNRSSIPEEKHCSFVGVSKRNSAPSQILFGCVSRLFMELSVLSAYLLLLSNCRVFSISLNSPGKKQDGLGFFPFAIFSCICHLCFNDLICSTIEQEIVEFPLLHSNACPVLPTSLLPFCTKTLLSFPSSSLLSSHD